MLTKDEVSDLYSHIDRTIQLAVEREKVNRAYEESMRQLRYFVSQQTKEPDKP